MGANLDASCILLHVLVACTLVELHQAFRRRKPQRWTCRVARVLSVGWFRLIHDLDTSLVVFLRGTGSGLGPPEVGIVCGLLSKEALFFGKRLSVVHTLQVWPHVLPNISGACIVLV